MACAAVSDRMQTGIFPGALGAFFDYYLASVVASEVGVVQRWFDRDLAETPETMARIMTVIAFVSPGRPLRHAHRRQCGRIWPQAHGTECRQLRNAPE